MWDKIKKSLLTDSLINFLILTGSICGFASAFGGQFNVALVLLVFALISFGTALVCRLKTWQRVLVYIVFIPGYFAILLKYSSVVNSGFYILINRIQDVAVDYLKITSIQEYRVIYDDSYVALSFFMCMFALLVIFLQNAFAVEQKCLGRVFALTMPLLLVYMYFRQTPNMIWQAFYFAGLALVAIIGYLERLEEPDRFRRHYTLVQQSTYGWVKLEDNSIIKEKAIKMKTYFTLAVTASVTAIVICLNLIMPSYLINQGLPDNKLKEKTTNFVSTAVLFGISGFFNDYYAKGGISGGYLGGVSSVRPDNKADLKVRFAPSSDNQTLYLRSFVGGDYTSKRWIPAVESAYDYDGILAMDIDNVNERDIVRREYAFGNPLTAYSRIDVQNIDANEHYTYIPYYSAPYEKTDSRSDKNLAKNGIINADGYVTMDTYLDFSKGKISVASDDKYVNHMRAYTFFMDVPFENKATLDNVVNSEIKPEGKTSEEIVEATKNYFYNNFTYTMSPGKTPGKADFVNYFLNDKKKGYCAHFASAGVLLLRECGIPARYVEGYALSAYDMQDGQIVEDADYQSYYDGYSELDVKTVIECDVTDAMAHAWVEYYDIDYGWRVADFTPPSDGDDDYGGLFGYLQGMMDRQFNADGDNANNNNNQVNAEQIKNSAGLLIRAIEGLILGLIALYLLVKFVKIRRRFYSRDKRKNLINLYSSICDKARKKCPVYEGYKFTDLRTHTDQMSYISRAYGLKNLSNLATYMQEISYSKSQVDLRDYKKMHSILLKSRLRMLFPFRKNKK